MLTFETGATLGMSAILEKLTVSRLIPEYIYVIKKTLDFAIREGQTPSGHT